ncbi:MAG: Outer rane receptor for ferrienterochelin and colicin [Acidobacteria bacterium]|nr:Outer rane receptor for ferrienterochelin and colicin [Acidobacteriota bacterium]
MKREHETDRSCRRENRINEFSACGFAAAQCSEALPQRCANLNNSRGYASVGRGAASQDFEENPPVRRSLVALCGGRAVEKRSRPGNYLRPRGARLSTKLGVLKGHRIIWAMVLCLAFCVIPSLAQTQGSISGHIRDEQGANISGADVRLRSREGLQQSTRTDANGLFHLDKLGAGIYLIEVKGSGFATLTNEIHLSPGQAEKLELNLKIAGINESVVVTAAGTPQRADEISKAVSLIDSQQIEARHELTLPEALRGIPGLRVQQQGSLGELTSLRLRGQRNYDTAILLDGLRLRDASDPNGSAFVLMADLVPLGLDRVEVLRGSGSSIYGTNAIGGVINMVPATASGRPRFEVGWEGGSLATYREHAVGSGGLGKRAGFTFGLNRIDVRRGVDGNDEYGNTAASGRFQFNATPSIMVAGNLYATISNARLNDSPFTLPAAFASGQQFRDAIAGVTFHPDINNPDEGRRNRVLAGSVRFSQRINDTFSYTAAYQHVSSKRRNYNGPKIEPRFASFYPFGDFAFTAFNEGTTDTLDARLNASFRTTNLATAGFEYEHESLFQNSIPSFSAFNGTTDRQRTFAIFGQDQIFLLEGRLQLSGGVRGQFYRIRAADRPASLGSITAKSSVTGDGSIAYFIRSTNTKLRGHVGNGFRAPALFERFGAGTFAGVGFVHFGDPTLRAEQSISVDAGVDQRLAQDRVLLGFTYFYTRLQRAIAFTGFTNDPLGAGRFSGYVNRRGGIARGLESSVEMTPFRATSIRASYSYTNSDRFVPGRGLLQEYVIPKHMLGLNLSQRYRAWSFNFDLNRTGSYLSLVFENDFPFRQADLKFRGFTKADLFATYERRVNERITAVLFAGADNLFDRTYFENGFRAAGIAARAGVNLKF